ncbi:hypothetical protein D3C80_622620 [compost metagenome]
MVNGPTGPIFPVDNGQTVTLTGSDVAVHECESVATTVYEPPTVAVYDVPTPTEVAPRNHS